MPKSKICLPDVNVWLALALDRHVHYPSASEWFASIGRDSAAFCRVTQMGFLRLLSNPKVMAEDVVSRRDAWKLYESLMRDRRVFFAPERPEIEEVWKRHSTSRLPGAQLWTDAYLAAFAQVRSWTLVSFDTDFRRWRSQELQVTLLE